MKKVYFYCLAPSLVLAAIQAPMTLAQEDGAVLLRERCSGCHPASVTTTKRKTPEQWQATVVQMKHRGARLTEAEMKALVDYLGETFKP